jgi:hypothetical protein
MVKRGSSVWFGGTAPRYGLELTLGDLKATSTEPTIQDDIGDVTATLTKRGPRRSEASTRPVPSWTP